MIADLQSKHILRLIAMAFDLQKIGHLKTIQSLHSNLYIDILWQENVMNTTCDYTIVWA